ncbi:DUF2442 domain-containing protein [Roseomonas sp. NAR14]|uniref:DUF2442 domain-containing protein n=1 Tax=Roseomonas acroporae TaxID=2937791 RepID=A0A9X2BTI0_9PROT|nr:DUF2442 domain-containing protein [Roseomonas acroporae]MCK8783236.1 DUF2442 domain-containing protein [Roseomonas acroporae]
MLQRITAVRVEPGRRLRVAFADGAEGEVDLAPLGMRDIVYVAIGAAPEAVQIGPGGSSIEWRGAEGEAMALSADALRLEMERRAIVLPG